MLKKLTAVLICAAVFAAYAPVLTARAAEMVEVTFAFGFTQEEFDAFSAEGGYFGPNSNITAEIVSDVVQDGDGSAYLLRHIEETDYGSVSNAVRVTFPEPLPEKTSYTLSLWFYVPSEGNADVETKKDLLGPGYLINFQPGIDAYKFPYSPQTAGIVEYDTWFNVTWTTSEKLREIEFIDFRFYTNDEPTHPEVWYIDNFSISYMAEAPEPSPTPSPSPSPIPSPSPSPTPYPSPTEAPPVPTDPPAPEKEPPGGLDINILIAVAAGVFVVIIAGGAETKRRKNKKAKADGGNAGANESDEKGEAAPNEGSEENKK
ncbi:MAG: hypothetical protein FWF03_00900 [Defluviitaleaceae bacterium]|nr:hypothetical protein [Defluviitaleaceae bacterium]